MHIKKIQTTRVLEVSMVERWAADAYLVTEMPRALKEAMERQTPKLSQRRAWLVLNYSSPILVLDRTPKGQSCSLLQGMCYIIGRRTIQ